MIKKEIVVNEIELNDLGQTVALKGKVVKVVEVPDMLWEFTKHQFHKDTLYILNECIWKEVDLDYCGG